MDNEKPQGRTLSRDGVIRKFRKEFSSKAPAMPPTVNFNGQPRKSYDLMDLMSQSYNPSTSIIEVEYQRLESNPQFFQVNVEITHRLNGSESHSTENYSMVYKPRGAYRPK